MKIRNPIEWSMVHWRIVVTLVSILVIFGAVSFLHMPRQEFPQFTIRQGIVVAVMPGSTSREVENEVTTKLESYLFGFEEVDKEKTYSYSRDGQVYVYVSLKESVSKTETAAFWARLRHGLNEFKSQSLPSQVAAVIAIDDFGDTSALLLALTAEGHSWSDMDIYMKTLEAELRRIPATSKLKRSGEQTESIRIWVSRDRLAQYGVRPLSVMQALQGSGVLPLAGRLDGADIERPIHVSPVLHSERELGETVLLAAGGNVVHLKDVARLERCYGDNDSYVRYNGKPAMILSLEMSHGNDITAYGKAVDAAIARVRAKLPPDVGIVRVADQPLAVTTAINHFMRDLVIAVIAVIAVIMVLLPLKVAAVAAITIPISIFITLGILNLLGIELETVSLAGLVVVLGMVVDNAIIVIDNHLEKIDHGMVAWNAAWKSARELMLSVFTATLAIILCYAPMSFMLPGTAGDFIKSLPTTVAVALIVSMLLAAFLVPVMDYAFIRKGVSGRRRKNGGRTVLERLQRFYDRCLVRAFQVPKLTIGIGVLSVVIGLVIMGKLPQQLFPKVERNQFAVEINLQKGRSLAATDSIATEIGKILRRDPRVINVTSFVGSSSPRFHTVYAPQMPSRSYAQLLVNTTSSETADSVALQYGRKFRAAFPNAWVRWKLLELQGFDAPVEIRLWGDSLPLLREAAEMVQDSVRRLPVEWFRTDWDDPLRGIALDMDWEEAGRLGISPSVLGASVAMGTSGLPVGTIWEADHPVKLMLKEDSLRAHTMEGFRTQLISSMPTGASVPFAQVATARPDWNEATIGHRNGIRCLTVKLDARTGTFGTALQAEVEKILSRTKLPAGVAVTYGGEKESTQETFVPMEIALVLSVAMVFLVILCQFKRFRKTTLVMLTMPLSIFGATLGLVICGYPFSFTAFIGIIGLMGIVVRNGIILVGYAEELRAKGQSIRQAALAAGKRRMRPIFLTSMAAAMGVVPMILSRSTLWGPLGSVTAFGLVFSMILTLFVLPVAYWLVSSTERSALEIPEVAREDA